MTRIITLVVSFVFFPCFAWGQSLTIDGALDRVDQLEELSRSNEARVRGLEAQAEQAGRWQGPGLRAEWFSVAERESELELIAGQQLPIDSAPSLARKALESQTKAAEFDASARLQMYKGEVAGVFFELLFVKQRLEVLEELVAAVERTRGFLKRRQAAGDASLFEVERVEREVRRLNLRIEREKANIEKVRAELSAWLQTPVQSVAGKLEVERCGGEVDTPPRIAAQNAQVEAARARVESAERTWIPELEVEAGWILNFDPQNDPANGYRLGLAFGLPLWVSRNLAVKAAEADVVAGQADVALETRRIELLAKGSQEQCKALQENAQGVAASIPKTQKLLERAESGYEAGELSLLELLDAQQAVLEDRLDLIETHYGAQRAQIEWTSIQGGW